jgi:hypothetical protein
VCGDDCWHGLNASNGDGGYNRQSERLVMQEAVRVYLQSYVRINYVDTFFLLTLATFMRNESSIQVHGRQDWI